MVHLKNIFDKDGYDTQIQWPERIVKMQYGRKGVVFNGNKSYRTAFFEVFTKDNFIRGEGRDVPSAEKEAYNALLKRESCEHIQYKPFGWNKSSGICVDCKHVKENMFPSSKSCCVCGKQEVYETAMDSNYKTLSYCMKHYIDVKTDNEITNEIIEVARICYNNGYLQSDNELENQTEFLKYHDISLKLSSEIYKKLMLYIKKYKEDNNLSDSVISDILDKVDELQIKYHKDIVATMFNIGDMETIYDSIIKDISLFTI